MSTMTAVRQKLAATIMATRTARLSRDLISSRKRDIVCKCCYANPEG
jgi:hypothetical protein